MLEVLKAALNDDASYFLKRNNITQIKHLNRDVVEYVIVGEGYFDFKGRDGLIKTLNKYLDDDHWLIEKVKEHQYKVSLERLSAFRNYAAHSGNKAKSRAKDAAGQKKYQQRVLGFVQTKMESFVTKGYQMTLTNCLRVSVPQATSRHPEEEKLQRLKKQSNIYFFLMALASTMAAVCSQFVIC